MAKYNCELPRRLGRLGYKTAYVAACSAVNRGMQFGSCTIDDPGLPLMANLLKSATFLWLQLTRDVLLTVGQWLERG